MREILFRGKRLDNGEWVEGSLHIEYGETTKDGNRAKDHRILGMRGECYYVDPASVGQFTGLLDKNGKQIFEGDVVRGPHIGDDLMVEPVEFSAFHGFTPFDYLREDLCEVIGNRFDNPELLEVTPGE